MHSETGQSDHVETNAAEDVQPEQHYWLSFRFLGSLLAIVLLGNSLFVGYSMPVNILSVIDADIGMYSSPDSQGQSLWHG